MVLKKTLLILASFLPAPLTLAQPPAVSPIMRFRAILHDPLKPTADLFFIDKEGVVVPLELNTQSLSPPQLSAQVNGSLVLYDKLAVDPKKPEVSIAAACKIPEGTKRAIFIILPSPAGTKPAYRMVCIDDSAKEFPKGESKVLAFITSEAAIEVGEHKLPIHPGAITSVPLVKKVNANNMAQTNFFFQQKEIWTPFAQRQIQCLDDIRRIFIIYKMPNISQPSLYIVEDTATTLLTP
jgi:hypothetical protein